MKRRCRTAEASIPGNLHFGVHSGPAKFHRASGSPHMSFQSCTRQVNQSPILTSRLQDAKRDMSRGLAFSRRGPGLGGILGLLAAGREEWHARQQKRERVAWQFE